MRPNNNIPTRSSGRLNNGNNGRLTKTKEKESKKSPVNKKQTEDSDKDSDDEVTITRINEGTVDATTKRKLNESSSLTAMNKLNARKATNPTNAFKTVNHESRHRRQCKRFGEELRSRTPDRNNLSRPKFKHSTRLTFKIHIPATDKPEEILINTLSEFFQELKKIDTNSSILPWKSSDRNKGNINKISELPTTIKALRTYLNKFYIGKQKNQVITTYPSIYIGHDKSIPEIREELHFWLSAGHHGLFEKMLQVENSSEIGWLLYSTKDMDAGALVDEIADIIGLQVGLRWKIIDIGAKGKLPEGQRVQALNVEVDSDQKWEAQKTLQSYFGRAMKDLEQYPNGIRLRFVKSKRDAINTVEKGKIEKLRARQKTFLDNIQSSATWDVVQLDYASKDDEPTLRQMIMGLTSKDGNIPLFHCVDLDWRGDGYVFQYAPQVKEEAECAVHNLPPILQHYFPDIDLDDHFSTTAIERCQGYKFDAKTGTIVDEDLGDQLSLIDDDNLLGFTFDIDTEQSPPENVNEVRPSTSNFAKYFPNEDDSVSTFARYKEPENNFTPITPINKQARKSQRSIHDTSSATSVTSTVTMETIHTIMDSKIAHLTTHVLDNNKKFDAIMKHLGIAEQDGHGSSPNAQDCAPDIGNSKAGRDSTSSSGNVH